MSFLKYLDDCGGNVPRTAEGYPLTGNRVPFLKQDEYDNLSLGLDAHVKTFATDVPEDMAQYEVIVDKVANGLFCRLAPDREEFLKDRACWLILVRWAEIKGEVPRSLYEKTGGYQR